MSVDQPVRAIEPVRAVIVHDHRMLSEGLRSALDGEPDIAVVGVAATVHEAEALVAATHPDVGLIESTLADGDATTCAEHLRRHEPALKLLLLADPSDTAEVGATAIEAGFDGMLGSGATLGEAVRAVRRVAAGDLVFDVRELTQAIAEARRGPRSLPAELTDREAQVFLLMAEGRSTAAMAKDLYLSPHTIRSHVARILRKLGVHSKAEAIALGYRRGYFSSSRARRAGAAQDLNGWRSTTATGSTTGGRRHAGPRPGPRPGREARPS